MKQTINFSQFCDAFKSYGRDNNFSYDGKEALFNYLENYEEDIGEEIELDVIALCCEYNEYADLAEFQAEYSDGYETLDDIRDQTTVIEIEGSEGFIIQCF
jgi:hypothetical protein